METEHKGEDKSNRPCGASKDDKGTIRENLMKPFKLGWRREVVMRVITDSCDCDIYYYHPSGKKLRSMTEVRANLTDGLTLECFTFKKKPLNVSSEIIRSALIRGQGTRKAGSGVGRVVRAHAPTSKVRQKVRTLKKTEKGKRVQSGTRRQVLMKKKEKLQRILDVKKMKPKIAPEKKNNRKKSVAEKAPKESKNYTKQSKRQNKFSNHVQCKVPETPPSANKLKLDTGRKRDCTDIRSIVQRNIGRYREFREMRKKQMKEGLQESKKASGRPSYKVVRRPRSEEPLSGNLEIYFKPLEKGWRRELVYRVNGPDAAGRSDVYYFHPSGKKLRSTREIADNLTHGLTMECFTFRKEALGFGEPHETIRNARLNKKSSTSSPPKKKKKVSSSSS